MGNHSRVGGQLPRAAPCGRSALVLISCVRARVGADVKTSHSVHRTRRLLELTRQRMGHHRRPVRVHARSGKEIANLGGTSVLRLLVVLEGILAHGGALVEQLLHARERKAHLLVGRLAQRFLQFQALCQDRSSRM